eukprot:1151399-Prorocentrum_minimum.AAC.3
MCDAPGVVVFMATPDEKVAATEKAENFGCGRQHAHHPRPSHGGGHAAKLENGCKLSFVRVYPNSFRVLGFEKLTGAAKVHHLFTYTNVNVMHIWQFTHGTARIVSTCIRQLRFLPKMMIAKAVVGRD